MGGFFGEACYGIFQRPGDADTADDAQGANIHVGYQVLVSHPGDLEVVHAHHADTVGIQYLLVEDVVDKRKFIAGELVFAQLVFRAGKGDDRGKEGGHLGDGIGGDLFLFAHGKGGDNRVLLSFRLHRVDLLHAAEGLAV